MLRRSVRRKSRRHRDHASPEGVLNRRSLLLGIPRGSTPSPLCRDIAGPPDPRTPLSHGVCSNTPNHGAEQRELRTISPGGRVQRIHAREIFRGVFRSRRKGFGAPPPSSLEQQMAPRERKPNPRYILAFSPSRAASQGSPEYIWPRPHEKPRAPSVRPKSKFFLPETLGELVTRGLQRTPHLQWPKALRGPTHPPHGRIHMTVRRAQARESVVLLRPLPPSLVLERR